MRSGEGDPKGGNEDPATDPDWVPAACTLPTADRAPRLAEFDELFTALRAVHRPSAARLSLRLAGSEQVQRQASALVASETRCCGFFAFTMSRDGDELLVEVGVPPERVAVLDGLTAQARRALA